VGTVARTSVSRPERQMVTGWCFRIGTRLYFAKLPAQANPRVVSLSTETTRPLEGVGMAHKRPDIHSAVERFTRTVRSVTARQPGEVFADFVQFAAYELANIKNSCPRRRERMGEICGHYSQSDRAIFREMREAFDTGVSLERDFLADAFDELDLQHHFRCFHPYSWMMATRLAELTLCAGDLDGKIRKYGCCRIIGDDSRSGGIVLAIAQMMLARGYDPQRYLYATEREAEPLLAYMCYLQLAALGIPAVVCVVPLEAKDPVERLYTPAHYERLPDILRGLRDSESRDIECA
jgi:hypothetical protein